MITWVVNRVNRPFLCFCFDFLLLMQFTDPMPSRTCAATFWEFRTQSALAQEAGKAKEGFIGEKRMILIYCNASPEIERHQNRGKND